MKGISYMVLGGLFITINDAFLKWMSGDYSVGQIIFVRGVFVVLLISVFVWRSGGIKTLRVHRPSLHIMRATLVVISTFLFITGLRYLPLADAITIAFAGPLFVTALAVPLLGEIVGWRRWLAVAVGFIGIIIIVRPSAEVTQMVALFPLAASLAGAFRDILTRYMSSTVSSLSMLFYTSLGVTLVGGITCLFHWQPMPLKDVALFAISGVLMCCAHFLMIETFRFAEVAFVAPFKYITIIWGIILGLIIWGDVPDQWTVLGATIIITSGLYILHREKNQL